MPSHEALAGFLAFFFYTLWIYFNFYSYGAITLKTSDYSSLSYQVSIFANGVALLLGATFHRRPQAHLLGHAVVAGSVLLCTLGTTLSATSAFFDESSFVAGILGGVFTGIGSASILLMLALLLSSNGAFIPSMLFGFLFSNAFAILLGVLPGPLLLLAVLIMPIASILCAIFALQGNLVASPPANPADVRPMIPLIVRAVAAISLLYLCVSIVNAVARSQVDAPNPWAVGITTVAIALFFLVSLSTEGRKINIVSIYRTVFFFSLVIILGTPFLYGEFDLSYGVVATVTTVVRAFIFLVEYRICIKTRLSPLVVFGVGETIKKLPGFFVRWALPTTACNALVAHQEIYTQALIALSFLITITYVLVFTEKHLIQLAKDDLPASQDETILNRRREIARSFALTDRETEVFMFLCEGRTAPWIASELYISQATVNVHVKNIYRKCDIHSRQALLDLVN